ncbi:MAG: aminoacyl-tRNA hydrolase [Clostridiaceae bacterium]|nr:aminoacyl-tRNA hydrolase [Clostridiaceae bacterium]
MYIIVGLGNPEKKYDGTRHNIGFSAITALADANRISVDTRKHKALIGKGVIAGQKVILAQPLTYMNLSGESIRELADYYKIDITNELIVIYDDINLAPGKLRIRAKGSAGGHNGIKNIIAQLGGQEFARIRIGVGEKPSGWDLVDYVLGRFPKEEEPAVREALDKAVQACEVILSDGIDAAMNRFNGAT